MTYRHPFTLCGFRFEASATGYPNMGTDRQAAESLASRLAQTITDPRQAAELFSTLWDYDNGFATIEAAALAPVREELGQLMHLLCESDPANESGRIGLAIPPASTMTIQ